MTLPKFVFLNNKTELPSREFMLLTRYPHILAEVVWLPDEAGVMNFLTENDGGIYTNIAGYRIYLVWRGTITGKLPLLHNTTEIIQDTILQMTQYYYEQRIDKNPDRYSRFAVKD